MSRKLLNPTAKTFQEPPGAHWITVVQWQSALSLQSRIGIVFVSYTVQNHLFPVSIKHGLWTEDWV